jgi:hypothetical protein
MLSKAGLYEIPVVVDPRISVLGSKRLGQLKYRIEGIFIEGDFIGSSMPCN